MPAPRATTTSLGLLKPAIVDRETGYRFYSAAQLPRLNRILVLKELGLSLEQIGRIIDDDVSPAELRAMCCSSAGPTSSRRLPPSRIACARSRRASRRSIRRQLAVDDVIIRAEPAHRI